MLCLCYEHGIHLSVCLSVCLSVTLLYCDYIVQQKVEMGTRPGLLYPVIPNFTEEDQCSIENVAASNSSHVTLSQHVLIFFYIGLLSCWRHTQHVKVKQPALL